LLTIILPSNIAGKVNALAKKFSRHSGWIKNN
jgi:predicted transcriptional regulator